MWLCGVTVGYKSFATYFLHVFLLLFPLTFSCLRWVSPSSSVCLVPSSSLATMPKEPKRLRFSVENLRNEVCLTGFKPYKELWRAQASQQVVIPRNAPAQGVLCRECGEWVPKADMKSHAKSNPEQHPYVPLKCHMYDRSSWNVLELTSSQHGNEAAYHKTSYDCQDSTTTPSGGSLHTRGGTSSHSLRWVRRLETTPLEMCIPT